LAFGWQTGSVKKAPQDVAFENCIFAYLMAGPPAFCDKV